MSSIKEKSVRNIEFRGKQAVSMSCIKEKSVRIIEVSGKQADWDGWSKKFLVQAQCCG